METICLFAHDSLIPEYKSFHLLFCACNVIQFIIESKSSKPCNLVRKSFVLILQRIDITSLTNPYNHIKTNCKTYQFFLGETQINRILAPCHRLID